MQAASMIELVIAAATYAAAPSTQSPQVRSCCGCLPEARVVVSTELALGVCDNGTFRVVRAPPGTNVSKMLEANASLSLMVAPGYAATTTPFHVSSDAASINISTGTLLAVVSRAGERITFYSAPDGHLLTEEVNRSFHPTVDQARPHAHGHAPPAREGVVEFLGLGHNDTEHD